MGTVANRVTTPVVVYTVPDTSVFSPADWLIDPSLAAVRNVPQKYWIIQGDQIVEMSQADQDAVDAIELATIKAEWVQMFRNNTQHLLERDGFQFNATGLPLSLHDRAFYTALNQRNTSGALAFPVDIETRDGRSTIQLVDAPALASLVELATQAVRSAQVSEIPFLAQIETATTVAEVEAIVDTRL